MARSAVHPSIKPLALRNAPNNLGEAADRSVSDDPNASETS